mgnify:CR=1 FL=1
MAKLAKLAKAECLTRRGPFARRILIILMHNIFLFNLFTAVDVMTLRVGGLFAQSHI